MFFAELLDIKLTLVFALIDQVVSDFDCLVGVENSIFVLVDLTEQSTNLHVSFAAVLQHFKFETWLFRVVEVIVQVVAVQMIDTGFQTDGTLL